MKSAACAAALLLSSIIPPGTSTTIEGELSHIWPESDEEAELWANAKTLVGGLQGAPEAGWPRPTPVAAEDPVSGTLWSGFYMVFNLGLSTFEGIEVLKIRETGDVWRTPLSLRPRTLELASPVLVIFRVFVPPHISTLHVDIEFELANGSKVGGEIHQHFSVLFERCGQESRPHISLTAGSKSVWFPWDRPYYVFLACNPETYPSRAVIIVQDRATLRPLAGWDGIVLLPAALASGLLYQPGDSPSSSPNLIVVPPGWYVGFLGTLEDGPPPTDRSPPNDIYPEFKLLWDELRTETRAGDSVTFAGFSPPRLSLP